ncbi:hypothetical protein [uncultured Psychrobacter sp.]|uniref:hypothetical protein n=1 Tax=uncultured Psychrobacter sp. TaxID=259303 RepID=UPI00260D9124|nr:hypothetical protein [uncultured Psychrobacter sp.]
MNESNSVISAKENNSNLDKYVREDILENGKRFEHADFTKKEMAYLYIYTYLLMHMGSYERMLKEQEHLFFDRIFNDNVLFVDFGCGCATSLLAIYSYVEEMKSLPWDTVASLPSNLTYIGKDINDELLESAIKLTKKTFNNYFRSYENHADSDEKCVIITTDIDNIGYKNIIFNFAYMLSQNGIEDYLESFVKKIVDSVKQYNCNYYLVYQNFYCAKNYNKMIAILERNKLIVTELKSEKNGLYSYSVIRNLDILDKDSLRSKYLNYSIARIVKGG